MDDTFLELLHNYLLHLLTSRTPPVLQKNTRCAEYSSGDRWGPTLMGTPRHCTNNAFRAVRQWRRAGAPRRHTHRVIARARRGKPAEPADVLDSEHTDSRRLGLWAQLEPELRPWRSHWDQWELRCERLRVEHVSAVRP